MSGRKPGCTAEFCCQGVDSWGLPDSLVCTHPPEKPTPSASIDSVDGLIDRLAELAPCRLDYDYETELATVYTIRGNANDRVWTDVGHGKTMQEAIRAAIFAKEPGK